MIRRTKPDIVVELFGLWDLYDARVHGESIDVGSPPWRTYMTGLMNHALDDLMAEGARVVIVTPPYVFGMDRRRFEAIEALYRSVAAQRPGVSVIAIQAAMNYLQPQRWDGIHFTPKRSRHARPCPRLAHRPGEDRAGDVSAGRETQVFDAVERSRTARPFGGVVAS